MAPRDRTGASPVSEPDVLYDRDVDKGALNGHRIAIVGYGSQGRAHALNLRDSGWQVRVGLRPDSPSRHLAAEDGIETESVAQACRWANVISVLIPDQVHGSVYQEAIRPALQPRDLLLFAHGFSLHYGLIVPPPGVDVALVAPVGPGAMLRRLFESGSGIPAVFAVHSDATGRAGDLALAYAAALGCTRAGVIPTSVQEETETDLFGEQAVLCGGLSHLIRAGYDTLVDAGYQPALAYFECVHQVKLITDVIYEGGVAFMHDHISDTAEFGDAVSGPRIIDERVREAMRAVLDDIRNGTFARRWIAETDAGMPLLSERREEEKGSAMEAVGARLRAMMPWLRSRRAV